MVPPVSISMPCEGTQKPRGALASPHAVQAQGLRLSLRAGARSLASPSAVQAQGFAFRLGLAPYACSRVGQAEPCKQSLDCPTLDPAHGL